MNCRLDGATLAVRKAVAAAATVPVESVGADEDFVDDISMDPLELESLGLIVEEVFSIPIDAESLFKTPIHRTSAALAAWCIRQSDQAAWAEARRKRA